MNGLIIGGLALLVLLAKRKKKSNTGNNAGGIGRVKYFKAMMEAQREGVPFGSYKPEDLTKEDKLALSYIGTKNGYKQGKKSVENGTEYAVAVWKYLNSKYKQISGIGATNLPYEVYTIVNENGDVIIEEHNYDKERDYQNAIQDVELAAMSNARSCGYWNTILYIASGGKFAWDSKYNGTTVISYGLRDELFGSRDSRGEALLRMSGKKVKESLPNEKKNYRKILNKDGAYIQSFAESLWQNADGADRFDSQEIADGVIEALMSVTSKEDAKDVILDYYYKSFDEQANYDGYIVDENQISDYDTYDDAHRKYYGIMDETFL